jgi:lysozyme
VASWEHTVVDLIIDLSHHNTADLAVLQAEGIVAIIHKATEGASVQDAEYRDRRDQARELGLLWGAYHYSSGASVSAQVENLLEHAGVRETEVVALDWESSSEGPDMTLAQARRFVEMVKSELGRWPMIYGGRLLREMVGSRRDEVLANCPLWYSRYRTVPIGIPTSTWPDYTLWQCSDGNSGPEPHIVRGVGRCDRNRFEGTVEELLQQWPFGRREENTPLGPGARSLSIGAETRPQSVTGVSKASRPRARRRKR